MSETLYDEIQSTLYDETQSTLHGETRSSLVVTVVTISFLFRYFYFCAAENERQ